MEFAFQPSPWQLFFDAPFLFPSFTTQQNNNNNVNWTESPDSHIYTANLPGVKKEEIKVEVEDSKYLIIRTEPINEETKPAVIFKKKIKLPSSINVGFISAGFEDGVLTITVPRSLFPRRRFQINPADLPTDHHHEILAPAA